MPALQRVYANEMGQQDRHLIVTQPSLIVVVIKTVHMPLRCHYKQTRAFSPH